MKKENLTDNQKLFFTAIQNIQEEAVNVALCHNMSTINIKDILYNVTYETIYSLMELFDGYGDENVKVDIIDINSKQSVKSGIQLHDVCVEFIKHKNG